MFHPSLKQIRKEGKAQMRRLVGLFLFCLPLVPLAAGAGGERNQRQAEKEQAHETSHLRFSLFPDLLQRWVEHLTPIE